MSTPVNLSSFAAQQGDPDALIADAARMAPGPRRASNSHVHLPPNFSAFDSVSQAVELATAQGIRVLGVSNYYHYGVYAEFAERALAAGIYPLFGTEIIALQDDLVQADVKINDPGNPGKMYVCGKGLTHLDPLTPRATALLEVIRQKDSTRMAAMVAKLGEVFAAAGFPNGLDEAAVKASVVRRHGCAPDTVYLQERHVTQAFQEALAASHTVEEQMAILERAYGAAPKASPEDAVPTQNEMRSKLLKAGKPAYVTETFVDLAHARNLILALGGIPCYPVLGDGAKPFCAFEETPEALVGHLREYGFTFAEFIPGRNQPDVLSRYAKALRAAGIVVTAGTEHNTRDLIPLVPSCAGGAPIPEDVADLFWEGICVVAAHQYLAGVGRTGYVDADGKPNAAFATADERIAFYRSLGETLIARG